MNSAKKFYIASIAAALLVAFMCGSASDLNIDELALSAADVPVSSGGAGSEKDTTDTAAPANSATNSSEQLFPDVEVNDWYYQDVKILYETGILNGYPDGYFYPEREITNAEFIKILLLTDFNVITANSIEQFPNHWASIYINAAYERGIITDSELKSGFNPDSPITRSAMTKMMILALGIEPARIDDPFIDISDKYASTAYNEYLLRGYLLDDGSRVYRGSDNAMRSEAAAIAVRIIKYREDSYTYKRDAVLENASKNPLNNEFELIDLFCILNREFITEFTFETELPISVWTEYYRHSNLINLEYFYSYAYRFLPGSTVYTIQFDYGSDIDKLIKYHYDAEEKADRIIAAIITENMTDFDKVKAIHDYLVLNCEYDYDNYLAGSLPYETRIAYGALCNKKAVCQGYTAAFNMLCSRAGIRSAAIGGFAPNSNDSHSWNMVLLDGQIYYVDVTHDDPVPDRKGKVSYRYFCLTESEMSSLGYVWDKSYSNIKYLY